MRYRLPEGCVGVSVVGTPLAPDETGTVTADATVAADLAVHGIVPVEEPATPGAPATKAPKGRART